MKLLYSHRTRSADGQYVHIRELTDALRARGHEIVVAGPGGEAERRTKALDAGSGRGSKSWLPAPIYECAEYGYSFAGYRRLSTLANTTQPDILYERYNLFYHAGIWLKRRTRLPLILEVNAPLAEERARHGDLALKSFARRSETAIWRAADMTAPVTNVLADRLRAAGVSDDKISVIQNGVSADFLDEPDPNIIRARLGLENKLVLGFTGFVRDWHRVDRVIECLARARRDDLHFLLVGDGPARQDLEQRAVTLGIADKMTVTGVVQREAMAAHVAAFDIALQPAVPRRSNCLSIWRSAKRSLRRIAPISAKC